MHCALDTERHSLSDMSHRPAQSLLLLTALLVRIVEPAAAWIQRFPDDHADFLDSTDVAVDAAGDVFVAGEIVVGTAPTSMMVSKLAGATGVEIWRKVFDPAPSPNGHADAVAVDSSGDVVVAGDYGGSPPYALAVAKLDGATGAELWLYLKPTSNGAKDVAFDASGDVVVSGWFAGEFFVAKLDGATGAELWTYAVEGLPGSSDGANVFAVDPGGDVFAAGVLDDDLYVVKIDGATGASLWSVQGDPDGLDVFHVAIDAAADVVVGADGGAVIKYDGATGAEEWRHVEPVGAPAIAIVGTSDVAAASRDGAFRLAGGLGTELWRHMWLDNRNGTHVAVSPSGAVFAGGRRTTWTEPFFLARFDAATGALDWLTDLDGSDRDFEDHVHALVVDPAGDPVVVGRLFDKDRPFRFLSLKADWADGSMAGLSGQTMVFRDKNPGDPTKRRVKFLVKGDEVQTPLPGSLNDPMLVGATIRLWNPSTLEEAILAAPAGADWKGIGNPPGINGYKYKDKTGANPCKVSIRPFKNLKVTCKANNGPIPFSLDEASQGGLAASLALGSAGPQCASFGGLVVRDAPGQFKAKKAPAAGACP